VSDGALTSDALILHVDATLESPWALCAFVALEEKQQPYTLKKVSLKDGEHRRPEHRAANGKIPALQHGDFWLAESMAIAEYMAETFPFPKGPRLYPEDLKKRGVCRMVQLWLRTDFMPIREERSSRSVFYRERPNAPLSSAARESADRLFNGLDVLIAEGQTTLCGTFCIGDADLGMMLQRLVANGDPVPSKLRAYAEAVWQRPSIQKWVNLPRGA
jgi:glutathione S-transferase